MRPDLKRNEFLQLAGLSSGQFDNRARRDQLPGMISIEVRERGRWKFSALDALMIIVTDDLARSYWGNVDLVGTARLAANGRFGVISNPDRLMATDRKDELWLGAVASRASAGEIAAAEFEASRPDASEETRRRYSEIIDGSAPPFVGTLPELVGQVIERVVDDEPSRIIASNISAAYRLMLARAARYEIDIPDDAAELFPGGRS